MCLTPAEHVLEDSPRHSIEGREAARERRVEGEAALRKTYTWSVYTANHRTTVRNSILQRSSHVIVCIRPKGAFKP
jgi:hypothetical protein